MDGKDAFPPPHRWLCIISILLNHSFCHLFSTLEAPFHEVLVEEEKAGDSFHSQAPQREGGRLTETPAGKQTGQECDRVTKDATLQLLNQHAAVAHGAFLFQVRKTFVCTHSKGTTRGELGE